MGWEGVKLGGEKEGMRLQEELGLMVMGSIRSYPPWQQPPCPLSLSGPVPATENC